MLSDMALTVSTGTASGKSNDVWGARKVTILKVTFDSDYLEGGESFDPVALGHQGPVDRIIVSARHNTRNATVHYDPTNKTLAAYGSGGTDATTVVAKSYGELCHCDLSALVCDVVVLSD